MKEQVKETYLLDTADKKEFIAIVYERYGKKLYSYSIHTWKMTEDVSWELIYKTIYKVAEVYKDYSFGSEEKFASFVFKIFINYLRNYYRDTKGERENLRMTDLEGHEIVLEEQAIPESEKMKALNEVLNGLEDWQRILLLMRTSGKPYSEIAAYVEKPEGQLKVYYQRLKELVSRKLNGRS